MEQILLAYGLPKETVAAMMMFYKNTKVKVHSLNGDTDFFDIVVGVLQEEKMALHWKMQEADDTPHKLLRTQTTLT